MLFSIVIPVYNVENYIADCVKSILSQQYKDYELILVDDGSTDGSGAICDEYAAMDPRIRVIHQENGGLSAARNAGVNSARNTGIAMARGDYICLVDSDDSVGEAWLSSLSSAIEASPSEPELVVFGYNEKHCDRIVVHIENCVPGFYDRSRLEREIFPHVIIPDHNKGALASIWVVPWTKAYKRELLLAHCSAAQGVRVNNDCTFTYECVFSAKSIFILNQALYDYSADSANSLQRSYHPDLFQNNLLLIQYLEKRLKNLHPSVPEQLNIFNAIHIIQPMYQEAVYYHGFWETRRRIQKGIEETGLLQYVDPKELPFIDKSRLIMMKMKLYGLYVAVQRALILLREKTGAGNNL